MTLRSTTSEPNEDSRLHGGASLALVSGGRGWAGWKFRSSFSRYSRTLLLTEGCVGAWVIGICGRLDWKDKSEQKHRTDHAELLLAPQTWPLGQRHQHAGCQLTSACSCFSTRRTMLVMEVAVQPIMLLPSPGPRSQISGKVYLAAAAGALGKMTPGSSCPPPRTGVCPSSEDLEPEPASGSGGGPGLQGRSTNADPQPRVCPHPTSLLSVQPSCKRLASLLQATYLRWE